MRRVLLGFTDAWPEDFPNKKRRLLIIFATITWLYRLTVFIGIAWLVYYFFFKVLGVILFIIEILWFVLLPIWHELKIWFKRKSEIKMNRVLLGLTFIGGLIALGLVPWQTTVRGTTWIHATKQSVIFTPIPGKLSDLAQAGAFNKGDRLFILTSPDIALQASRAQALSEASSAQLRGLSGLEDGEEKRAELQFQQEKFNAEVKLYKDEINRLDLTAPFAGILQDIDENLSIGTWVHPKQPLASLIDPNSWVADVLVEESQIARIHKDDKVTVYIQQSAFEKRYGRVAEIDTLKIQALPHPMLDAQNGGAISTLPGTGHIPTQAFYKVRVVFDTQKDLSKMLLAEAAIETQAKAWLPTFFERVAALFVRESGF
jgi:putative peptide zinc metalloprotease protein